MKKALAFFMIVAMLIASMFSFAACDIYMSDIEASKKKLKEVFSLIDKRDKEGLLNLYAVSARNENPNIGDEIDAFFESIEGELTVERFWCSDGSTAQYEYGKQARYPSGVNEVIILIGNVRYNVNIDFCSINTFDKKKQGILVLEFANEEAYTSPYFVWHSNRPYDSEDDDLPGLYYQHSSQKREDIIFVEERAHKLKQFDRQLTKEHLIEAANQSDDYFASFANIIGEPNSKWVIFGYYYYLLDDGMVAVIVLNDDLLPLDEQNRHMKMDDIGAIYLANEETYLETIWLAPNIAIKNDSLDSRRSRYYYNNNV